MSALKEHSSESVPAASASKQEAGELLDMSVSADGSGIGLQRHGGTIEHDTPPGATAQKVGHWIHQHKELPQKNLLGFTGYQFIRSAIAAVPYGASMALTLLGFTKAEMVGNKMASEAVEGTLKHSAGKRMAQFASTPAIKTAGLVATSFTLYRGTSKLVKWITEYLFNPKDSEEKTVAKVRDLPHETWRKVKEIAPAEASSTPIAAVVLGFVCSFFSKGGSQVKNKDTKQWELKGAIPNELDYTHANFKSKSGFGNKARLMRDVITHPKARFIEQAGIFAIGYSLFFEMGDRLYKDMQIRRDIWPGDPHSTKALKATPDAYEEGIQKQQRLEDEGGRKYDDSARSAKTTHLKYGRFTEEPSVTRFVFRRVAPTMLGIGAYTAFKFRHAYMVAGDFVYNTSKPLLRQAPKLALLEGAATSLFFLVPWVAEPWEKSYDKFFDNLEKKAQAKSAGHGLHAGSLNGPGGVQYTVNAGAVRPAADQSNVPSQMNDNHAALEASPKIQQNFTQLLDKLNDKEQAHSVASAR